MSDATTSTLFARSAEILVRVAFVIFVCLGAVACATPPSSPEGRAAFEEANDPLEPMNREIFTFNLFVDHNLIKPAAEAYRFVVPPPLRSGIHNMLLTLRTPALFADLLFEGEFRAAGDTLFRLAFNLTVGFGGFFDAADQIAHVKAHDTDFGIVLARWGAGEGPFLMLPLFGPSNPRDGIGLGVNSVMDPLGYFIPWWGSAVRSVVEGIDKREPLIEPLDELERTSIDFYAALRSLYRQHRAEAIRGKSGTQNIPAPSISEMEAPDEIVAALPPGTSPAASPPSTTLPAATLPTAALPAAIPPVTTATLAPARMPSASHQKAIETVALKPLASEKPVTSRNAGASGTLAVTVSEMEATDAVAPTMPTRIAPHPALSAQ